MVAPTIHTAACSRLPGFTRCSRPLPQFRVSKFGANLKPSRSHNVSRLACTATAAANELLTASSLQALQLVMAVTVIAAFLPQIIAVAKPYLLPIRCRTCLGATTNLCSACASRGKVGGLFTSQALSQCQQCKGLGRVTCNSCKGKGMVNSWLWQTDMSDPKKAPLQPAESARGQRENAPLFETTEDGEDDGPPQSFPYPRLGDNTVRKSFRDLVKEQQKQWRV